MDAEEPRFVPQAEVLASRPRLIGAVRFEGLWVTGSLAGLARPSVAVVGTRAPSDAGRRRAHAIAQELAAAGVCVVSGLALGVDGAAHAGALAGGGPTVGVLGGGHGHFFPKRNRALAEAMLAGGAVVSPFAPDVPARPWQFLERNGVVAALADVVLVVEAAARSGALNTASWAANLGIDVLAVPGDVDRPKAAGCNALIRDGATLVRDAADVLAALGITRPAAPKGSDAPGDALHGSLLRKLAAGPRDLDALVAGSEAQPGAILAALVELELAGTIVSEDGHYHLAKTRA
jgi:DNA processing protein